ncbi:Beta-galactosidase BgaA [Paenibacillus plantiphilus]|uniref:Beta-galactosidase n=1 Tax=Paenibacillus plantiphilus TaxID=2905650 RepID=A0ABN8H383_9BACL|nr:beta-galactosidase [Paenibacillus plantiphilus]CAH1223431.1 Beta-galactosidase BgaA [Paenibacillus plantiphilus]
MSKSLTLNELRLGVCYYPEHWDETIWPDDFQRMREMGISIIRIGEFGWSLMEPEEGVFDFSLFDRAVNLAAKFGLQVIMGTPTATPPAWLTQRYPEVLNASHDGTVYQHGGRRHYNYSSTKYRELCAVITRKLAENYKDHPAIIGWQIDNELNCEVNVFYADADHRAFREWLKKKYGTLDQLNHAWGATFWSQTYTDWEQVHLLRPTASNSPNPHQALDEKRFISDNTISFAKLQSDILREVVHNQWVTTNTLFGHLNYHELTGEALDFLSYDSYPLFSTVRPEPGDNPLLDRKWSMNLSAVRSISPNFCVMEQQAGPGGWVNRVGVPSPRPGQLRLWTYQSIAHGADLISYFRWRTATVGTEMYWFGINDHHNQSNRRIEELQRVGVECATIGGKIAGTRYAAKIAIVRDYDNEWDGELDNWHGPMDKQSSLEWFKALQYSHIPTDFLYLHSGITLEEMLKYEVLVYPHPAIMTEETAELMKQYVQRGGTVIFGCRTGYKDEFGHCNMRLSPGPVAELCGIAVEDFTHVIPSEEATQIHFSGGQDAYTADLFNEVIRLESPSVEVMAEYSSKYYKGKPALTRNKVGDGYAWYYGASFNQYVIYEMIARLGIQSPIQEHCIVPKEVEVSIRQSGDRKLLFLLNFSSDSAEITFKHQVEDILTQQQHTGTIMLEPYGVIIVEITS